MAGTAHKAEGHTEFLGKPSFQLTHSKVSTLAWDFNIQDLNMCWTFWSHRKTSRRPTWSPPAFCCWRGATVDLGPELFEPALGTISEVLWASQEWFPSCDQQQTTDLFLSSFVQSFSCCHVSALLSTQVHMCCKSKLQVSQLIPNSSLV